VVFMLLNITCGLNMHFHLIWKQVSQLMLSVNFPSEKIHWHSITKTKLPLALPLSSTLAPHALALPLARPSHVQPSSPPSYQDYSNLDLAPKSA
jgi:hypothetical protein